MDWGNQKGDRPIIKCIIEQTIAREEATGKTMTADTNKNHNKFGQMEYHQADQSKKYTQKLSM